MKFLRSTLRSLAFCVVPPTSVQLAMWSGRVVCATLARGRSRAQRTATYVALRTSFMIHCPSRERGGCGMRDVPHPTVDPRHCPFQLTASSDFDRAETDTPV